MLCETVSTLYSFFSKKEGAWFPFNKVCAKSMRKTPPLKVCVFQNPHPTKTFNKFNVKKVTSPSFVLYPSHCRLHRTKTRGKNKTVSTVSTQAWHLGLSRHVFLGAEELLQTSSSVEKKNADSPKDDFWGPSHYQQKTKHVYLYVCRYFITYVYIYIYM